MSLRLGAAIVLLVAAVALLSRVYVPYNPNQVNFLNRLAAPSAAHPLGTDHFGRDILSRVMVGAQNALWVGMVAVGIGLGAGLVLGLVAGYAGGWWDRAVMAVMDALYAFPALLLALLLATAWGPGATSSMVAVGVSAVPAFARVTRASVMAVKPQAYVEAARAIGAPAGHLLRRHVLPNILGPLAIQSSFAFGVAVLAEAALSYLGLGTQPPHPSWGRMLREAQSFLVLSPYPALFPGLAIALSVLGFNLVGDGLRDRLDVNGRVRPRGAPRRSRRGGQGEATPHGPLGTWRVEAAPVPPVAGGGVDGRDRATGVVWPGPKAGEPK